MTISATVLFRRDGQDAWRRGIYRFLQLPNAGDRIVVTDDGGLDAPNGVVDTFVVLYVEHHVQDDDAAQPEATIVVEWLTGEAS